MNNNFLGNEYKYFIGVVEDNIDPMKLNQCRVRIVGLHSKDKSLIPTESLPWAQNISGNIPNPGDLVKGFFLDGSSSQIPVIEGIFPKIPEDKPNDQFGFTDSRTKEQLKSSPVKIKDYNPKEDGTGLEFTNNDAEKYPNILNEPTTSRLARNENLDKTSLALKSKSQVKKIKNINWGEPNSPYNALYPYNNVKETNSGHIFEFDDTPNHERINLFHRTGSFIEFHPNGDKVNKTIKNNFEFIHGSDYEYTMGNKNIVIQGDSNVYIMGNKKIIIDGDIEWNVKGNWTTNIEGNLKEVIKGSVSQESSGVTFKTPTIKTNGSITSDKDQIAGGISQMTHGHTGVISGDEISGPPIGANGTPISDSTVANQLLAIYEA